jgi:hypothetical protein
MRFTPILITGAVFFAIMFGSTSAQDRQNPHLLNLRELVTFSDLIVTGETVAISSEWNDAMDHIFTYVDVAVDSVVKGSAAADIVVKLYGGTVDTISHLIPESPRFALYSRSLLFLAAFDVDTLTNDTLNYEVMHLHLGKLSILKNQDGQDVLFWAPAPEYEITPADSLSPAYEGQPEPLTDMLSAIESLLP